VAVDFLAKALRPRCSMCGAGGLEWLSPWEAERAGLPVAEAIEYLGRVQSVWRCLVCGEVGFFGPDMPL